jgi:hypothetical protein
MDPLLRSAIPGGARLCRLHRSGATSQTGLWRISDASETRRIDSRAKGGFPPESAQAYKARARDNSGHRSPVTAGIHLGLNQS